MIDKGEPPSATVCYSLRSRSPQAVSSHPGDAHISQEESGRIKEILPWNCSKRTKR
ncbi:protein of unknown function (plasmid) [Shinella sp. WSC3-e]|nr:hypothetical protein SHINE37_90126 [Rhizobiaceae bacterium]CAK7262343.1 protein of unknown function [Shinella sp. WSC3-e]